MAVKKTLKSHGKHAAGRHRAEGNRHRGERQGPNRLLVTGLAVALGSSALIGAKGDDILKNAAGAIADSRAYLGDDINVGEGSMPTALPTRVKTAIGQSTVKVVFSERNDNTGYTVSGTGVAVRGGVFTAGHVGMDPNKKTRDSDDPRPLSCENGMLQQSDNYASVERRTAQWNETSDLALLRENVDFDNKAVPAPMTDEKIVAGEILYGSSYQPFSAEQERGPLEARKPGTPNYDEYAQPVIIGAVAIAERDGQEVLLAGLRSYGEGAAAGVDRVDHGASGGPLFDEEGRVRAIIKGMIGGELLSKTEVQRTLGITIEGADPDQRFQIMTATPIGNEQADAMARMPSQSC